MPHRPAQPARGRLPDLTPPTGANGPPTWSVLQDPSRFRTLPPGSLRDTRPAQWLLLFLWGRRQGLGQGLGRGLGLPEQEFVEQRVDGLRTLQHHHVTAFIDELQEGQEQDLQRRRAQSG